MDAEIESLREPLPRIARPNPSAERAGQPPEQALDRVLDYIDYGIVCVSATAFIEYCNRSARKLINHCPVLAVRDCHLMCAERRETTRLHAAIGAVALNGVPRLVTLSDACQRVHVSIVPLNTDASTRADVAVFLGQTQASSSLSLHWYGVDHGLTPAERAVLAGLSEGLEPGAVARAGGVALSTVRTQIASIRNKTGSASIGALLREVAQLPPVLPPPRLGVSA